LGLRVAAGTVAASAALAGARDASACGGCFHPPTQTVTDITDERMLLAVSTTQSTLYDQIRYSGSPSSFAWVLPIQGTVDVGLSADVLFDSIDTLTATQIVAPPSSCPGFPSGCFAGFGAAGNSVDASSAADPAVTVTKQENVGPYATVQLHATDSSALSNWLAQNGYAIPTEVTPVIAAYVSEGFDFLAMKLLPNQGIQAMRPVRVTTQGASLSLPLRMASVGTGVTVGITIWVVSDGRYEPANFPSYHIDDSLLVWDWSTTSSNYTTLRSTLEASSNNTAWEIESSIDINQQVITNTILSGGVYYRFGGIGALPPSDPSADYLPVGDPDAGTDGGDAGASQTAEQVRDADIAALFVGLSGPNVRVSRMRSDIAHAAMTKDFVLQASADQTELSNVRNVTTSINQVCPIYGSNCQQIGTGTPAEAAAANASVNASMGDGGAASSGGSSRGSSSYGGASTGSVSRSGGSSGVKSSGGASSSSLAGNGAGNGAMAAGGGGSQGCAASPANLSGSGTGAALAGLGAALALVASRGARARRRRTRAK
jgi:hypothetical protein